MNKYSIFGAGKLGIKALEEIGTKNVNYIIDNDATKWGTKIRDVEVIGIEAYAQKGINDIVIIPFGQYALEMKEQCEEYGIEATRLFRCIRKTSGDKTLIVNPYVDSSGLSYEYERSKYNRELTNLYVKQLYEETPLFNTIEIETYNRCNGLCDFCPVSIKNETRIEKKMEYSLFEKIILELADINYSGAASLHSNNEPFMDDRIIEMQAYMRNKLPKAHLRLYTNGTLLTLEKFKKIIPNLDELIIDNYNDALELNSPVKIIADYCKNDLELRKKVSIVLRKQHEVLTSRGGDAPNVSGQKKYLKDSCMLPFKQMIVRPSGEVSLCCNDPLGKYTLGDLNKQSIKDIWYGEAYQEIRNKIKDGRQYINKCSGCDTFFG